MKAALAFFATAAILLGQGGQAGRDPAWRTLGTPGVLAARPATCRANQDVYICNGAGCGAGIEIHYCTATNTWAVATGSGGLPTHSANKFLWTDGTAAAWRTLAGGALGAITCDMTTNPLTCDIVPGAVARPAAAETITGAWTFSTPPVGVGAVITTEGYYVPDWGIEHSGAYLAFSSAGANKQYGAQFIHRQTGTYTALKLFVQTGLSGGEGLRAAIFNSNCTSAVATSNVFTAATTGSISLTFSSFTLPPGVYWLALTTDSTTFSVSTSNWTSTLYSPFLGTRYGLMANSGTGAGASVAFAATCGAAGGGGTYLIPNFILLP